MNLKTSLIVLAGAAATATAGDQTDLERAYASEIRADASNRSSLLDNHEGNIDVIGRIQFRYQANFNDYNDDDMFGFHMRRVRLGAAGDLTDTVSFKIQADFAGTEIVELEIEEDGPGDNGEVDEEVNWFELKDAYVDFAIGDNGRLRVGQHKPFITKENYVSSGSQLAVDRSATNNFFSPDRVQGVEYMHTMEAFRFAVGFADGYNTDNTGYRSFNEADYQLYARGEFLFNGDWSATRQFTSWRGSPTTNVLGAGISWQDGGSTGAYPEPSSTTPDVEMLDITIDYQHLADGWNVFAAGHFNSIETTGGDADNFGFLVQGGVFLSDQFELFARYDAIFGDDDAFSEDTFSTLTGGFNYYITPRSHAVKVTVDGVYYFDETMGSPVSGPNDGLALTASDDSQFAIRAQLTVNF